MKHFSIVICSLLTSVLVAQKNALGDILWEEAGGRINLSEDHGGQYEITDDATNGYLKVAFTEDGCGCYSETTVAAFKDKKSNYTTLKMYWDGCGNRRWLSAGKGLKSMLPQGFGLSEFCPTAANSPQADLNAIFYLETEIPQKGTETTLQLKYVPFGIDQQGDSGVLSSQGYNFPHSKADQTNYYEDIKGMIRKFQDSQTMDCLSGENLQSIAKEDREKIDMLFGEGKKYERYDTLFAIISRLENYYIMAKTVEYKAIILDWNRDEARFYIKEKIKNDAPERSFLEFVQQLPFLMAVC